MSGNKITQTYIFNIARSKEVDKNQNGKLEGDEISIFEKKLEKEGITNPQIYVNSFNNSKKSISANVITKEIDDAFATWGWTWLDDLDKAINKINSGNVLEVLESYDDGDSLIEELDDELTCGEERFAKYGTTIINALLEVAKQRNIDVSDIVTETTNGASKAYAVGPSVKDANQDKPVTDSDNLDLVVAALRERIEYTTGLMTGSNITPENKQNAMLSIAYQVDSKGNNDGNISGDEIGKFKEACAKVGIFINDILSSIAKKTDKKQALTEEEELVKNIFSGSYAQVNYNNIKTSNQVDAIVSAIKDKDEDELRNYISSETVNADNVEILLSKLDSNEDFMRLPTHTKVSMLAGRNFYTYSDNNDIGQKLVNKFKDDAREFNAVILKALYERAEANDVDVSDIVKCSNDEFFTPDGDYALDSKHVNKVIESVRQRINEKLDK